MSNWWGSVDIISLYYLDMIFFLRHHATYIEADRVARAAPSYLKVSCFPIKSVPAVGDLAWGGVQMEEVPVGEVPVREYSDKFSLQAESQETEVAEIAIKCHRT